MVINVKLSKKEEVVSGTMAFHCEKPESMVKVMRRLPAGVDVNEDTSEQKSLQGTKPVTHIERVREASAPAY